MFRNPTPIGEAVVLGNSHDRLLKVVCSERSLRLAHKHLLQYSQENFQGFLIGTINLNEGIKFLDIFCFFTSNSHKKTIKIARFNKL